MCILIKAKLIRAKEVIASLEQENLILRNRVQTLLNSNRSKPDINQILNNELIIPEGERPIKVIRKERMKQRLDQMYLESQIEEEE